MTSALAYREKPRLCRACRHARGTNRACPTCRRRREAENVRMSRTREGWREAGLCAECGAEPSREGVTCDRCKAMARKKARARNLACWLQG